MFTPLIFIAKIQKANPLFFDLIVSLSIILPFTFFLLLNNNVNKIYCSMIFLIMFIILILHFILIFKSKLKFSLKYKYTIFSNSCLFILILFHEFEFERIDLILTQGILSYYVLTKIFQKSTNYLLIILQIIVLFIYFSVKSISQIKINEISIVIIAFICLLKKLIKKKTIINAFDENFYKDSNIGEISFEKEGKIIYCCKNFLKLLDINFKKNKKMCKLIPFFQDFTITNLEKKINFLRSLKGHSTKPLQMLEIDLRELNDSNIIEYTKKNFSITKDNDKNLLEELERMFPNIFQTKQIIKKIKKKSEKKTFKFKLSKFLKSLSIVLENLFCDKNFDNEPPEIAGELEKNVILLENFHISKKSTSDLYKMSIYKNTISQINWIKVSKSNEQEINNTLDEVKQIFSGVVSSLSHEMRTPMNCSLNLLELLCNSVNKEIFQEFLIPIILSTKNLKLIINDLIDYSNITSGKFFLEYSRFDLRKSVNEIIDILMIQASNKGIKIILDFESELDSIICSDLNRIKQIVFNLLSNSVKFTKKGCIIIQIKKLANLKTQNFIQIQITDTGSGMSITELSQLGKISQKKSSKLVGLGLTTSNYIAEFLCPSPLNGLYVESSEGFGSKFLFLIENMSDISFEQENKLTKLDTRLIEKTSKYDLESFSSHKNNKDNSTFKDINDDEDLDESEFEDFSLPRNAQKYFEDNFECKFIESTNSERILKKIQKKSIEMKEFEESNSAIFSQIDNLYEEKISKESSSQRKRKSLNKPTIILSKIEFSGNYLPSITCFSKEKDLTTNSSSLKSKSTLKYRSFISQGTNDLIKENSPIEMLKLKGFNRKCDCPIALIVDDGSFNLLALEKMLKSYNIKADCANSGDLAIEKVKDFYYSSNCISNFQCKFYKIIFMDIDMPFKDGITTTKEILEIYNEQKIVSCTAFNDEEIINKCKEAGMVEFISKPMNIEKLEQILIKIVCPIYN